MKKLLVGLLAAFLMSAGLVAVVGSSPAQAVCGNPQYPACFKTQTGLTVTPSRNGPARRTFTASVRAVGTNARPVGRFVFRFKRIGGDTSFTTRAVPPDGSVTLTRTFNRGRWNVIVAYQAKSGTVFQSSLSDDLQFRVRR